MCPSSYAICFEEEEEEEEDGEGEGEIEKDRDKKGIWCSPSDSINRPFFLMYGSMGKRMGEIIKRTFGKSLLMGLNKTLAKLHSSLYYQWGGEKPKREDLSCF